MSNLHFKTIAELAAALEAGETTSVMITQAVIDRTAAVDEKVQAFLHSDAEDALSQARAADDRRTAGKVRGTLDGIPIGIKDTLAVAGQPLRCASKMLENYVSPFDATCIAKLKEAGAIIYGRLNMDEFAMGSSTENSAYQTTANPWDLETIPGGSSGGRCCGSCGRSSDCYDWYRYGRLDPSAGCALWCRRDEANLWSDLSLRLGGFCFFSRSGRTAFARTVEDAALLLQAMLGKDPLDSTSIAPQGETDYATALRKKKGP